METAKAETTNETTLNEVMSKLYRSLTITQANIFLHLRKAQGDEDLKRRATEIIKDLKIIIVKYEEPVNGKPCGNGQVRNPLTGNCE